MYNFNHGGTFNTYTYFFLNYYNDFRVLAGQDIQAA